MSERATINGVPADRYGTWCPHGQRIEVPDPDDTGDYPRTVFAEPWPCTGGCTPQTVTTAMEEEAAAYEADRWAEYRDTIAEGLSFGNHAIYVEGDGS
jgi:hypothetical protein